MSNYSEKSNLGTILGGLKLGMLLQFGGMGPICVLLFQLSAILPLKTVLSGVWAVTLADAVYILISIFGIVGILKQMTKTSQVFSKINGLIIIFLGLSFSLMLFSDKVSYVDAYDWQSQNVFLILFILTILNPVTVICFTGVFNAKLMDTKMSNRQLYLYGLGTLLSTPIFMSAVVVIGSFGTSFLPEIVIKAMNIVVGVILILWGVKYIFPNLFKKKV